MTEFYKNGRHVRRLQTWLLLLTMLVLGGAVAAPIIGASILSKNATEIQLVVTCQSARSNIAQLEAQRAFARRLGVPWDYPIPEVPVECDGH